MSYADIYFPPVSRRPLIWLNIFCLDAPIVAISWQWLFARVFGVALPSAEREALFITAWLIYLFDRFADSVSLPDDVPKSARQQFCRQHKKLWLVLILASALLDAGIAFTGVGRETFVFGVLLGAIAAVYLTVNHAFSKLWRVIPLKEMIVGFLFATGTLLVLGLRLPPARLAIAVAALLFASLCTLNCVSIAVWERDLDRAQGRHSVATRSLRVKFDVRTASFVLGAVSGLLVLFDPHLWPIWVCLGVSAILLAALHFAAIARDERTALADLVLLTPLALMLTERIL